MRPSVPTSHPALGVAKATAQNPAHIRQREPGRAFVRSPGSGSGRKRGRVIGGDHHGASEIVSAAATSLSDITQPEYGAGYRRRIRESPCSAAIAGNRSARVIGITGIQIAAAHDSVVRIAEINGECAALGELNNGVSYAFQVFP